MLSWWQIADDTLHVSLPTPVFFSGHQEPSLSSDQSFHEWYALISICQRRLILFDMIDIIFIIFSTGLITNP